MMTEGITVYLRMRPTTQPSEDYDVGADGRSLMIRDVAAKAAGRDSQRAFKFDQVLPMDITQAQVFERVGKRVVQNALDGYNSTVFAYGQTGSGKTFTITGGSEKYEDRGIIPRALSMIFQEFRSRSDCSWSAHISYMEIYNEEIRDLLSRDPDGNRSHINLVNGHNGLTQVLNLEERVVESSEEVNDVVAAGLKRRQVGRTAMNHVSSRSHAK